MVLDPGRDISKGMQRLQDFHTSPGMSPHHLPFILIQFCRLVQDGFRYTELANVMHQGGILKADRVNVLLQVGWQIPVEQHRHFLDIPAMAIQIRIPGINDADKDFRNIDTSFLGCVYQVGKQRQDDGNKDGAKEEY